jgi:hypothetical protein
MADPMNVAAARRVLGVIPIDGDVLEQHSP